MSLIDEALKRARLDAARQAGAADNPRGGFASPWSHMPEARGGRRGGARRVALGAAMAVSLLIGGTGILLSLRSAGRAELGGGGGGPGAGGSAAGASAARGAGAETRATGNGVPPAPARRQTSDRSGLAEPGRAERDGQGRAARDEPGRAERDKRARGAERAPATADRDAARTAVAGAALPAPGEAGTAGREPAAATTDPPARQEVAAPGTFGTFGTSGTSAASAARPGGPPAGGGAPPAGAGAAGTAGAATEATPTGAGAAARPAGSGTATAPAPATSAAAAPVMADGGTYLGMVRLADGGTVQLSGIAWSDASPAALINGRVLGPGESLGDVTVEKIEPHRVTLRHRSGALFHMRVK
jgi:hypothetical protein